MAWDMEIAQELKRLTKPKIQHAFYEAVVEKENPLTFSVHEGELMFPSGPLLLTKTAASYAGVDRWRVGDKAAALLGGGTLLIIDKIGG